MKHLSFDEKVLKLANSLRSSGFDKYADSLEKFFSAYKISLANEKVNDKFIECPLLDQAHSDGSVEICETPSHEGVVETLQDRQKKIKEIALKDPKKEASLDLNPKYKAAKISQVLLALGVASHLKSVNDAYGLIMNAYYGPYNVWEQNQYAATKLSGSKNHLSSDYNPNLSSFFKLNKAIKDSKVKEKIDEKIGYLRSIFSKSQYGSDEVAEAVKAVNDVITNSIGTLYQIFLMKVFAGNDIYNSSELDIKKAGYDWWTDLKKAQTILETLRGQISSQKGSSDESTPEGYWHPGDFKAACNAATTAVSTLNFASPELAEARGEFLDDIIALHYYFSKGYLSNDAISNSESLNGKINLSKLPQIINNLATKTIRDNSAQIGASVEATTSFDAFKNLLGRWVTYFKKNGK